MTCKTESCSGEVKYRSLALCEKCYKKHNWSLLKADPVKREARLRRQREWARKARGSDARVIAQREWQKENRARLKQDPEWVARERARQKQAKRDQYAAWSPEERAAYNARQTHRNTGWSPAEAEEVLSAQGGRCAVCSRELVGHKVKQHDHYETLDGERCKQQTKGAIKHTRGILCRPCNSGLGHYEAPEGQRAAGLRIEPYEVYIAKYGG